jgi:YD repeat-containing protein
MKKPILYMILFLATAKTQAQGVSFGYDAHGNRISRRAIGVAAVSKTAAIQNTALAPLLQDIPDALQTSEVQVFPNPAQAEFQVILPPSNAAETIQLYDSNGREVRSQSSQNPNVEISDLPSGTYLLRVGKLGLWRVVKI